MLEIARLFAMGMRDVFCGVYRYATSKSPKAVNNVAGKRHELQIGNLSVLASILVRAFFLNVMMFGCSYHLFNSVFRWLLVLGLYVLTFVTPINSELLSTCYPEFLVFFTVLWIVPLFVISELTSKLWWKEVADITRKRPPNQKSNSSILANLSDCLCTTVFHFVFWAQTYLLYFVPIVGNLLYPILMVLLYSWFAFEYKWRGFGWKLHERVGYIERNWPYFLGFGSPFALFFVLRFSLLSCGLCWFLFLPSVISANHSVPPRAKHNFRIRVFKPTTYLTTMIFKFWESLQGGKRFKEKEKST